MIEKTVLDYLNRKLDVPVYMEVPEKPEKEYVVIEKREAEQRTISVPLFLQYSQFRTPCCTLHS